MMTTKEYIKKFFPNSEPYDKEWVKKVSLIDNVLFHVETLCKAMPIQKGMRVLDLGCGKAGSSIFLAKEFNVQVWAVDKKFSPSENYNRVLEADCENKVYPIKADAKNLPFPRNFFDVVLAVDAYACFGTDERYLPYLAQFIRPSGYIGILDCCFSKELDTSEKVPDFIKPIYERDWYSVHTLGWWQKIWEKTGLVKIIDAEVLSQSDFFWQEYIKKAKKMPGEKELVQAVSDDQDKLIRFFRLVGQRTEKKAFLETFE